MARYLISFDDGTMTFPKEDLPDVDRAAHEALEDAKAAGVWVTGGGLESHEQVSVVAVNGTVTDGPIPEKNGYLGGFAIVEVPSRELALTWGAKFAAACRCAQDVREIGEDPRV
jgi:hypothetical protein